MNLKPPTIPFGVVACTLSDNPSRNSCISRVLRRSLYRLSSLSFSPRTLESLTVCRSLHKGSTFSSVFFKDPEGLSCRGMNQWPLARQTGAYPVELTGWQLLLLLFLASSCKAQWRSTQSRYIEVNESQH